MDTLRGEKGPSQWQLGETFFGTFFGDSEMPLVNYTKVTKGTGPVRRLGKIEHGTYISSHSSLLRRVVFFTKAAVQPQEGAWKNTFN